MLGKAHWASFDTKTGERIMCSKCGYTVELKDGVFLLDVRCPGCGKKMKGVKGKGQFRFPLY